jgi:hypothetical protein
MFFPETVPGAADQLSALTVKELREMARSIHSAQNDVTIRGYSSMKKADLVARLSLSDAWDFAELRVSALSWEDEQREMNEIRAEIAAEAAAAADELAAAETAAEDAVDARIRAEYEAASIDEAIDRDVEAGTYSRTNEVAILRDAPGRAIVTAAFDGRTVGGSIVRRGNRYMLVAGTIKIKANSLEKVAKRFAQRLGFHADVIDIDRTVC